MNDHETSPVETLEEIGRLPGVQESLRDDELQSTDTATHTRAIATAIRAMEVAKKYFEDNDMTYCVEMGVRHEHELYAQLREALAELRQAQGDK